MLASKNSVFATVLLIAALPALLTTYTLGASWLAKFEGHAYPVTENVVVTAQEKTSAGLFVFVRFDKVRPCEFVSLTFYDRAGNLVRPNFDPDAERELDGVSRPTGANTAGPWLLPGVHTLEGGRFYAVHQCHQLWQTQSQFWPER